MKRNWCLCARDSYYLFFVFLFFAFCARKTVWSSTMINKYEAIFSCQSFLFHVQWSRLFCTKNTKPDVRKKKKLISASLLLDAPTCAVVRLRCVKYEKLHSLLKFTMENCLLFFYPYFYFLKLVSTELQYFPDLFRIIPLYNQIIQCSHISITWVNRNIHTFFRVNDMLSNLSNLCNWERPQFRD